MATLKNKRAARTTEYSPSCYGELLEFISDSNEVGVELTPACGKHALVESETQMLLSLRRMPKRIAVDRERAMISASSNVTWAELDEAAAAEGFYLDVAGRRGERSVGGLLGESAQMPRIWKSGAPTSRLLGMHALSASGHEFRSRPFPRTSSGPEFKELWIGSEGRAGVILECQFEALRVPTSTMVLADSDGEAGAALRALMVRWPSVVRIESWRQGQWLVTVIGEGSLVDVVQGRLEAIGCKYSEDSPALSPRAAAVVVIPWLLLPEILAEAGDKVEIEAAGPTHLRVLLQMARRRELGAAQAQAMRWLSASGDLPVWMGWRRWAPAPSESTREVQL